MKVLQWTYFCVLLSIGGAATAHADSFEHLLAKAPAAANTLVLIDVERTLSSPLAQKEGWGKKLELAYVDRPIFLPPEATKLVLAGNLRSGNSFQRTWELAIMELTDPLSMRSIARAEGGYVDTLNGTEVAWTPSNAYFVAFDDHELGVMFPADRQLVSRWIGFAKQNQSIVLSDYLSKATQLTNDKIQILFAIDLKDVVQPHELAQKIEDSPLFQQAKLTSKEVLPILTSLRGAVLRVAIGNGAQAQLRIDFGQDVTPLEPIAKELVLLALGNLGAPVDDIQSWKIEVKGQTIFMQGPLSQDGQRRVFSVIELPSAKFSMLKDEPESSDVPEESLVRESSLTYFRSVGVLLRDLRSDLRKGNANTLIMERYAGRIDRMPILNVDDDLLSYGTDVAETLRMVAMSKREGGIAAGVGTAGMSGNGYSDYGYNYGGRGFGVGGRGGRDRYAGARQSAADRSSIKAQALAQSKNARVQGSKMIADSTAAIDRMMTKKYKVEF